VELSADVLELLRKDDEFLLYRDKPSSVLLLAPVSTRPALESLRKIEHEYSLKDELDPAWAVRPLALSQHRGQTTLVLEDPGGETLDRLLPGPLETTQFLRFAVGLATALGGLHKEELIHKDLKPANVLVNSTTGEVHLMGFGIASRLPRERQAPEPPEFIAGTLPYMAPEQTGRMNRSIDSRSDLYALGVTLYEMLTGSLPFSASDPMEWVHCHIARQPEPPGERLKDIPGPVSAIIMKLLAKVAEERYQTAAGAASDLRRCLAQWETQRRIDEFPLGEDDNPDRLLIPEKLYGRGAEVNSLLACFDRVVASGKPELVLVSGYSGIGKSSVVNELHKPLVPPRGLFASGKFDQYKRDIPYATLAQAFQGLLRTLLTKSEAELSKWREALLGAVDSNGQLIADLVPELKLIIGDQPPVADVPLRDAQARFHSVFRRFINVFAQPEHPLAMFLDDLQWLDAATLDLLEDLLTRPDVKHLLLIGAYRDNEVSSAHPLTRKLEAIRQAGARVQHIVLTPLSTEDLTQLIMDSVHCETERATPLAQLIHEKTAGNPFFAIQLISVLLDEGLLTFNHGEGQWTWDLNRIYAKGYTDNVVDLMVGKLSHLPAETQKALRQMACLGNGARFATLQTIAQNSAEEMHAQLWEAIRAGLVFRAEDSYRFLHDRVQEASYSLIAKKQRAEVHLRIGRLLASKTRPEDMDERVFDIVNQLNRASHLIGSREEREQLAEFNLIAGRRAKNSTAFASALTYFAAGRAMLTHAAWDENYELIFEIEYLTAQCELLTADMQAAENRLLMLAQRIQRAHDIALVTRLRLTLYLALDRSDRGVEVCLEFLRQSGIVLSPRPSGDEVVREYDRIWSLLGGRQIEELLNLPMITNPDILDVLEVLTEIVTAAVSVDRNLCSLVICRMVNLSIEHGNSDGSCFAYVWLAIIAGPRFGNYQDGFRFGQLGYELVEKRGLTRYQARTYMCFGNIVMPWVKHVLEGRDLVRHAFDTAYRTSDYTFAAYSVYQLLTNLIFAGDRLLEVQAEAEKSLEFARSARFGLVVDFITSQLQLVRTLRGLTEKFGCFNEEEFDESEFELHLANNPGLASPEFGHWALKTQARFVAGDYASAVDASFKTQRLLWATPTLLEPAEFRFYSALSHAAFWDSASTNEKAKHFEALTAHYKELKICAEHCPANFEDRAALVAAEIARIEGREFDAMGLYEQAIRAAHANGFVHDEAVAYEVAARFYAARRFDAFADAYLREARYAYDRWGADGKVRQLEHLYPHLSKEEPASSATSTIVRRVDFLDQATVIKLSQALSGEMVLEKLIDTLMRTAIEHAGAERGLLILIRGVEGHIAAEAVTGGGAVTVHLRADSIDPDLAPESIIRYVMRAQENVILDDALSRNSFSADPYIIQHRVRSVLCLPLITQDKLAGVLYLENHLNSHVFTPHRIVVLKVLASQAAISLENTRLYRDLENREAKIRRLVDANILGIVIWNLEGAIVGANEAFLRMVQYSREELDSGRVHWTELTPVEWHESDERALANLNKTGTARPYEKELFRKDGSRVPVLAGGALFEEGGSEGVAFVLDLSEQKRAEEQVVKNEERTRLMLDEALDAVVTMDTQGVITGWNTQAEVIFGWSRAEACGRRVSETIIPERRREAHERGLRHFLATGEGAVLKQRIEMTALARDGREFPVELSVTPLKLGQTWIFSAFIRDITERKQGEEALEKAFEEIKVLKDQLYRENLALRDEVDRASMFEEIVGTSKALTAVLSRIAKVAPTDSTVFITGETGTGKELIARAVHKRSHRAGRAFVSVNCAALAPSLISSELFGHEKGAFTGAVQRRLGRFELADGGTIFLDEVGELLPDTQAALLRVLQEREFERVGGAHPIHVDVRVIAATNRDLEAATANGTFRQDLFYRLNVFPIEVPPLRKRKDDLLMLVEYFVQRYAGRAGKNIRSINKKTLDLLLSYDWPGNIRELQNVIERSVILSAGDVFSIDELWLSRESSPLVPEVQTVVPSKGERSEREIIEAALAESKGRVSGPSGAAAKLKIAPSTLAHRIKALNINKSQFKFG
jgi:PAS domain S-box-containing protein